MAIGKNFTILFSAMVVGHALAFILLPVFTWVFTPEMFGVFSYYSYLIAFISIPITLGYESQITNSRSDKDGYGLVQLVMWFSLIFGCILLFILWPVYAHLDGVKYALWLSLLTIFSAVVANVLTALQFFCVKKQHYKNLALSNFLNQGGRSVTQLGSGWLLMSSLGIVGGDIIGRMITVFILIWQRFSIRKILQIPSRTDFIAYMRRYRADSLWYMGSSLMEITIMWFPFLALATLSGINNGGIAAMTIRLLFVPSGMVGKALADIYHGYVNNFRWQLTWGNIPLSQLGLLLIFISSFSLVTIIWVFAHLMNPETLLNLLPETWRSLYSMSLLLIPAVVIQMTAQSFVRYAVMSGLNSIRFLFYIALAISLVSLYGYANYTAMQIESILTYYIYLYVGGHFLYYLILSFSTPKKSFKKI